MYAPQLFIILGLTAIFLNSCIIVLHFHPSKTSRNSYDRLILIFAVLDIIFAVLHSILLPIFVYQGGIAAFLSVGIFCCFSFSQVLLNLLYITYLSFIVLVTHSFIYRFAYLCKSPILHILERLEYELFVCICPLIIASPFMIVGNLKFGPREAVDAMLENTVKDSEVDFQNAAYFAKVVGTGDSAYGIAIFMKLLIIAVAVCAICAWCTTMITRRLNKQILSHRARKMHRRMLQLLVSQSLLPLITLYTPVIFFIISLFLDIPVGQNSSFIMALLFTLFPSLDAMLVSFFVKDYRPFAKKEAPKKPSRFATAVTMAMAVRHFSAMASGPHSQKF